MCNPEEADMIYALCGPSGVGKTTVLKRLLACQPQLEALVTLTTRAPRSEEVNHVDYHFVSQETFQQEMHVGHIVCPLSYRGEWYGIRRTDLLACTAKEVVAVLRPDKLSALQTLTPLVGIYLSGDKDNETIAAEDQIIVAHRHQCRYQMVNRPGDLERTVEQVLTLLRTYTGGLPWNKPRSIA